LTRVPEVSFQERSRKPVDVGKAQSDNAHTIAKINHLNRDKSDGFMEALLGARTDLAGLPFVMGDACRMKGERSREFGQTLILIRRLLAQAGVPAPPPAPAVQPTSSTSLPRTGSTTSSRISLGAAASRQLVVVQTRVQRPGPSGDQSKDFWIEFQAACLEQD